MFILIQYYHITEIVGTPIAYAGTSYVALDETPDGLGGSKTNVALRRRFIYRITLCPKWGECDKQFEFNIFSTADNNRFFSTL